MGSHIEIIVFVEYNTMCITASLPIRVDRCFLRPHLSLSIHYMVIYRQLYDGSLAYTSQYVLPQVPAASQPPPQAVSGFCAWPGTSCSPGPAFCPTHPSVVGRWRSASADDPGPDPGPVRAQGPGKYRRIDHGARGQPEGRKWGKMGGRIMAVMPARSQVILYSNSVPWPWQLPVVGDSRLWTTSLRPPPGFGQALVGCIRL